MPKRRHATVEDEGAPDSRRSARHPFVQFLWFHGLGAGRSGIGHTLDVSDHGMGFISSLRLIPNELAFLVILTPFGRISAIATVMHTTEHGPNSFRIGVRLDVVPPTDRAAWTTLVAKGAS